MAKDLILTLGGLAVVWFSLASAAAYVIGPSHLCYAAFPSEVCHIALGI
jgi:hypothetical protein